MVLHMDHAHNNGFNRQNRQNGHDEQLVNFEVLAKKVDYTRLLELGRELLIAIGEDPDRAGLVEAPRR